METDFLRHDKHGYPPMDLKFEGEGRLLENPTPQEARNFFIQGQKGEMQRTIKRMDEYFSELDIQMAYLHTIQEHNTDIGAVIEHIGDLRHQIKVFIEEAQQTYKQRITQIAALSNEEIVMTDPNDKRRTVVSGVVRKLMDNSYPQTHAALRQVNELKKQISAAVDGVIAKYSAPSDNASSAEV